MKLHELLKERILVLDGAMGTMIQQYRLSENDYRGTEFKDIEAPVKGNNDLLSLTQPAIIREIHLAYLEAGADIIETNTFNANRISQADYNMQHLSYRINFESAQLAKSVAEKVTAKDPQKPRFVAGAVGPTNRTASLSPDVNDPGFRNITFDELVEAYTEQCRGLLDGGADILLVETVFDTLNAKAALFAVSGLFDEYKKSWPVMVSGTITDASGRTLSGQTPLAFAVSMGHFPLLSIGFNCALGAGQLQPYLKDLARHVDCFISAHPNAGLPNEFGEYDQQPSEMANLIEQYLQENLVNIIGGCCGTTPDHIAAIAAVSARYAPRNLSVNEA